MSFENQVGNFESYIEIVKNVSTYNPNEADLKVTALTALAASLTTKSNSQHHLSKSEPSPRPARQDRVHGRGLNR